MRAAGRATEVDGCGTKPSPTEDQVTLCVAHLSGSAAMDVTLEVYEGDRGAWFKSKPVAVPLPSEVPGSRSAAARSRANTSRNTRAMGG